MRTSQTMLGGLLTSLLICGFECIPANRMTSVGAITGTSSDKLADTRMDEVFRGIADMLSSHGFRGTGDAKPTHVFPGGRMYMHGFWLEPAVSCDVEVGRKYVLIRLREFEKASNSAPPHAVESQRELVRKLALELQDYLHASLPASYETHVTCENQTG